MTSDALNCGGCGTVCGGGLICTGGQCVCPGGGTPCGGQCTDLQTDLLNCGACGVACGGGQTCTSGSCQCLNVAVSFASDIQPIFTANCALRGCHGSLRPQEGMDLSAGAAFGSLVNVSASQCGSRLRVAPGDPAASYLMDKLLGVDLCYGSQMPKIGVSLAKNDIDRIGAWICNGAQNN